MNSNTKKIAVALAVSVVLGLALFGIWTIIAESEERLPDHLFVSVDSRTGCHYLRYDNGRYLTPRLDQNGKQICENAR